MEGLAITHIGIEDLAEAEIKETINKDAKADFAALTFPVDDLKELCTLCYKARLLQSVMLKIAEFKLKDPEDVKQVDTSLFERWIPKDKTFAVRCRRMGEHVFGSQEVEQELGELIFESLKRKVNLESPDVTVLAYVIRDKCYIGIDFAGVDISKREYKIFSPGESLKGTTAQAMNCIAGINKDQKILDPFASSGMFSIEAALYLQDKSVHFYNKDDFAFLKLPALEGEDFEKFFEAEDKKINEYKLDLFCSDYLQRNVRSAEKNAKIAGVNKLIRFSRLEIEWLDTKFEEGSVDRIVAHPPQVSKRTKPEQIVKLLDELLYVSKLILDDKGKLVILFNRPEMLDKSLEKHGFKKEKTIELWQGKVCLHILVLVKA